MKVTEHIKNANGKTLFSIEILPPLKGENIKSLFDNIDPLMEFKPPFIDVTYHREEYVYKKKENGLLEKRSTRKRPGTVGICAAIQNRYKVDTVPHIICGGFNREETGINVPIIPGIKPITAKSQATILPTIFHIDLPEELADEVEKCKDNAAVREVGIKWAVQQSKELMKFGVPTMHFYSMGKSDPIYKIAKQLF